MERKKLYFFAIMSMFMLIACAPPTIKTTALVPGRFDEAAKLKEVAVLQFDGSNGKEVSTEIEGALASINIHDKQYFTVVDRVKLDRAVSEMKLSQSAFVDPNTAVKVGKMVGAKGIYTGTVTASTSTDSNYNEKRTRCAYTRTYKDKKGREQEECAKTEEYNVSCTKRNAIFSFTPKLIEVESGRVVYSNNISKTAMASVCEDSQKSLTSGSELIGQAKEEAITIFKTDVAPYYVQFEIKLIDSTDGIASKEAEKKFEEGIAFAKNNRLDRACELWGEARVLSPNSLSILYSLGICAEIIGDAEMALDLYKNADRLLSSPDEKVSAAIHRVSEAVQKQKKLKEQMGK